MKILLVNRWYPPHTGFGGVAVYQRYLGRALARQGHQVTVLAARWSKDAPAEHEDEGVRVRRIYAAEWARLKRLPLLGRYVRPLRQYLYGVQIARFINAMPERPDVIEFAEVNAEGYAYLKGKHSIPVIVRCHTPTFVLRKYYAPQEMNFDTEIVSRMELSSILRADGLSAPSRDMAEVIAQSAGIPPGKIAVIPNALDADEFASLPKTPRDSDETTLLHVGRLERVKGVETLAKAFCLIYPRAPQARLVFVGGDLPDGMGSRWRARLERLFAEHRALEAVHFAGETTQAELLAWYRRADIAVVPSMLYESFSYACAQAMAAGLPVVASRIGGIPETLGEAGRLAEPGDAEQLADALLSLIRAPQRERIELGARARARAKSLFDAPVVAGQTAAFYKSVIQ